MPPRALIRWVDNMPDPETVERAKARIASLKS